MQINLKDIADKWCKECIKSSDKATNPDNDCRECLGRLLKLHQTIALQEIAGDLKKIANPPYVINDFKRREK